jgi:hypothetical protein
MPSNGGDRAHEMYFVVMTSSNNTVINLHLFRPDPTHPDDGTWPTAEALTLGAGVELGPVKKNGRARFLIW